MRLSSSKAANADVNNNVHREESQKPISLSWSLTICYHYRREILTYGQCCVVAMNALNMNVAHRRTLVTHCCELKQIHMFTTYSSMTIKLQYVH